MLRCIYLSVSVMGSFTVKQVKLNCIFYFNTQSNCYRSYSCSKGAGIAQSTQCLTASWVVWGLNAGGGRCFGPTQTNPEAQPASCTISTGLFPGDEVARVWCWMPALPVLRSCIQRAIPLLPFYACLTCNGTAITFIHIQIPYKHITSDDGL